MSAKDKEVTEKATRDYTHVEFDTMTCPVAGCVSGKGGTPREGTVPGIKRHVKLAHGEQVYAQTTFPDKRSTKGPVSDQPIEELRAAAKTRKIADVDKLTKAELVAALVG